MPCQMLTVIPTLGEANYTDRNYQKVGRALKWKDSLVTNPALALDPDHAVIILVEGCVQGLFSSKNNKLEKYFNNVDSAKWIEARDIVNPKSPHKPITAGYAQRFLKCLSN